MWIRSENGSLNKPADIDTTSSKVYNTIRKEFEQVAATEEVPAHWTWLEQKVPKEDWEVFMKVSDHDTALDDVYEALTELADLIVGEE